MSVIWIAAAFIVAMVLAGVFFSLAVSVYIVRAAYQHCVGRRRARLTTLVPKIH
jgi:predicted alternative tryptophan synthase beta-subunit